MMVCDHEINLTEEFWISDDEVDVIAECSVCEKKFRGVLKEND